MTLRLAIKKTLGTGGRTMRSLAPLGLLLALSAVARQPAKLAVLFKSHVNSK